MSFKIYRCETCGKMVLVMKESGAPIVCCGNVMKELVAGTNEGSVEKHLPVYSVENNVVNVRVGSVDHPMIKEHYIEWIAIVTGNGYQIKYLNPGDKPFASFMISSGDEVKEVYAYCNLHDLWKA